MKPGYFPVSPPSSRASISVAHRVCNADNAAITRLWLGSTGSDGGQAVGMMLGEPRKLGLADALSVCCDGLWGLPESDPHDLARRHGADLRGAHGQQPQ